MKRWAISVNYIIDTPHHVGTYKAISLFNGTEDEMNAMKEKALKVEYGDIDLADFIPNLDSVEGVIVTPVSKDIFEALHDVLEGDKTPDFPTAAFFPDEDEGEVLFEDDEY